MLDFVEERLKISYLLDQELLTVQEQGLDVIKGLSQDQKSLPPRYFYDQKGSQLFEQICGLPEYYPTRTEVSILNNYAQEIAQITGPCELVELGSGSSTKTRLLLSAYEKFKYPLVYVPIDVSKTIVEDSAEQLLLDYPWLKIKALIGTYELALSQLSSSTLQSRMVCFLGSTLGNFSQDECDLFFQMVEKSLNPGDYFLLGIDLQKEIGLLECAYNDQEGITANFNLNILSHLNRMFEGNFDLNNFEHWAYYNQEKSQIEMHLKPQNNQIINLNKLDFQCQITQEATILTEISRKFNLTEISGYLEKQRLSPVKIWQDSKRWFAIILCQTS